MACGCGDGAVSRVLCTRLQYLMLSVEAVTTIQENLLFCLGIIIHLENIYLQRLFMLAHVAEHNRLSFVEGRIFINSLASITAKY